MSIWLKRLILTALFFGLLPGAILEAQDASTQENGAGAIASGDGGFRALSGAEASFFVLPDDVDLVSSRRLERYGLTYERYQQVFGNAKVLGGQLTLYRNDAGDITIVIGAHYPGIVPTNAVRLAAAEAHGIVDRDIGPGGRRFTDLMIDPRSGRYFFRVETRRPDSRWILWIGAQGGLVLNKYDALAHEDKCDDVAKPCGFGVEYDDGDTADIKDFTGLTTLSDSKNYLWSVDGFETAMGTSIGTIGTYDYWGPTNPDGKTPPATDDDNLWILPGDDSPAQPALVDGHYYARLTSQYLMEKHGYDWVFESGFPNMTVVVHYGTNYANAFWNGSYIALGDGNQPTGYFREFTDLDIVAHELAHGVTEFEGGLIYQNESGALNEAFSDIIGNSVEFYADVNGFNPASLGPNWLVGENIDLRDDDAYGFRNMEDPEEDDDPDHYSELYTGSLDNGGVHSNSGIANHAYYLLVNGGKNASCLSPSDHNSDHCTASPTVAGIGLADAEQIFFMGFTMIPPNATFCNARDATVAIAGDSLLGFGPTQRDSTIDAWAAVGLTYDFCLDPPPQVEITVPGQATTVSGKRSKVVASAQDDDGVTAVQFFLNDGTTKTPIGNGAIGSDGWSTRWDTKKFTDGNYELTAIAWDTASQPTESDPVLITVANSKGGDDNGDTGTVNCKKKANRDNPDLCPGG